jgi:hypothetical protein
MDILTTIIQWLKENATEQDEDIYCLFSSHDEPYMPFQAAVAENARSHPRLRL